MPAEQQPMAFAARDEFLDALRRQRLLTPVQADALTPAILTGFLDARALAKELLQRGWLTAYQINQLFQGKGQDLVLGSYVLLEKLGEGGMGTVFKARNWKLDKIVALKVIKAERLANPNVLKRFQREIRAAAQLNHPHIVRAFDADEVNGVFFFVMEFVEGVDLSALVKKQGPLPVEQACDFIRQAALGLQHAHERGMVHRDIKPHNLLLAFSRDAERSADVALRSASRLNDGVVKILDMGLALAETSGDQDHSSTMTQEGMVMGTPDYMAPEQSLNSHDVDIRADLYSLGCTLYYLLTGKQPFTGGTLAEKLLKHQLQEPPAIEKLRPEVPSEVSQIVRKLLAKRPEDRYQTPAELAVALAHLNTADASADPRGAGRRPADAAGQVGDLPHDNSDHFSATLPMVQNLRQEEERRRRQTQWWLVGGIGLVGSLALILLIVKVIVPLVSSGDRPLPPNPVVKVKEKGVDKEPAKEKGNLKKKELDAKIQTLALAGGPVTAEWLGAVKELPADEQARAVFAKLKALNVGFNDQHKKNHFETLDGVVVSLAFEQPCTDISPLRALTGLAKLDIHPQEYSHYHAPPIISVADLTPLKGLPLKEINLLGHRLGDLSPLAGSPVEKLNVATSLTEDLSPLAKCPNLVELNIQGTLVRDLTPLKNLSLRSLHANNTFVDNLAPLAEHPLTELRLRFTNVRDLTPVRTLKKLSILALDGSRVEDLAPLEDKRLQWLQIEGNPLPSLEQLPKHNIHTTYLSCSIPTDQDLAALARLRPDIINGQFTADFWKVMRPGPDHDEFMKKAAALAPKDLVAAVCQRLGDLNGAVPDAQFSETGGQVTGLHFLGPKDQTLPPEKFRLANLTPLEALPHLRSLEIDGAQSLGILNLWPLRKMPLEHLKAPAPVIDMSPLAAMPLRSLKIPLAGSLVPLAKCPLENLELGNVQTHDLEPLRKAPLKSLSANWYIIKSLAPLRDAPLTSISLDYLAERHGTDLRALKNLENINGKKTADFWKDIAEQQAEFVRRELKRLNGPDTKVETSIEDGDLVELKVKAQNLTDLRCLKGLGQLRRLHLFSGLNGKVTLQPLQGFPLVHLSLANVQVDSLSHLKGMALESLQVLHGEPVTDIQSLADMPLTTLHIDMTGVADWAPLRRLPKLTTLTLVSHKPVRAAWLEGLPVENLDLLRAPLVGDLSPLKKLPVKSLYWEMQPYRGDIELLRAMPMLESINFKKAKEFLKEAEEKMAAFQKWCDAVAKLPAKDQAKAVEDELKKRNPAFVGDMACEIAKDQVIGFSASTAVGLQDIAPLRAFPGLRQVSLGGDPKGTVANLYPLRGLPLERLHVASEALTDLTALEDMKGLRYLNIHNTSVADLGPLRMLDLSELHCGYGKVTDLSPLAGTKLTVLIVPLTRISDLSPLRGLPLKQLSLYGTSVQDLSPLKGMTLEELEVQGGKVSDHRILKDMPLKSLGLDFVPWRDSALIRSIKTLQSVLGKPAREFHAWADWEDTVRAATPKQQIEMLKAKLIEVNGPATIVQGVSLGPLDEAKQVITTLYCYGDFKDISPVRALRDVHNLFLGQGLESGKKSNLADIGPLLGLKLKKLSLHGTAVTDLSPVRGMELEWLALSATTIEDLTPLKGMPLKEIWARSNKFKSLEPLRGMKLEKLDVSYGQLLDLEPLRGMPLTWLSVAVQPKIKDLSALAGMKLTRFNIYGTGVNDLTPLAKMPLTSIQLGATRVTDLSPLQGAPLVNFNMQEHPGPKDWSPLAGVKLEEYYGPLNPYRDLEFLRSMRGSLKKVNNEPAADFWKKADKERADFDAWVAGVRSLKTPEERFAAVKARTEELNPKLVEGGGVWGAKFQAEGGQFVEVNFMAHIYQDISPVRALGPIKTLLLGRGLTHPPSVRSNLKDLSALHGLHIEKLSLHNTEVEDLRPLAGMPLTWLKITGAKVTDLSPLREMSLVEIELDYVAERDAPVLRQIKSLQKINGKNAAEVLK